MKENGDANQRRVRFDAPRDRVWLAVRDPDVLGTILPGGQGIEEIGENQYAGKLQIKMGRCKGFDGKIALSNLVAPQSYDVVVDGKGAPGFVNASGSLLLTEQGDKTHMVYEGTAQVGGRVAAVGQRLLDASAKSMVRQSLMRSTSMCRHSRRLHVMVRPKPIQLANRQRVESKFLAIHRRHRLNWHSM